MPEPDVVNVPLKVRFNPGATVTPAAEMVRLLKFCVPVPLMEVLAPFRVRVEALPVKVPLFIKFPVTEWLKVLPSNFVIAPLVILPVT